MKLADRKLVKEGNWLFTCKMEPVQFEKFLHNNPDDYDRKNFTDEEWEKFIYYDDFITKDGSNHSVTNCGLSLISEEYAKFFIEHELWSLYNKTNCFEKYEIEVKEFCKQHNIEYEGF